MVGLVRRCASKNSRLSRFCWSLAGKVARPARKSIVGPFKGLAGLSAAVVLRVGAQGTIVGSVAALSECIRLIAHHHHPARRHTEELPTRAALHDNPLPRLQCCKTSIRENANGRSVKLLHDMSQIERMKKKERIRPQRMAARMSRILRHPCKFLLCRADSVGFVFREVISGGNIATVNPIEFHAPFTEFQIEGNTRRKTTVRKLERLCHCCTSYYPTKSSAYRGGINPHKPLILGFDFNPNLTEPESEFPFLHAAFQIILFCPLCAVSADSIREQFQKGNLERTVHVLLSFVAAGCVPQ